MSLKLWMTIKAIIVVLFGLGFLLIPATMGTLFGTSTDETGLLLGRFFGMAWIFEAILLWLAKNFPWPEAQKIVIAIVISNVIGLVLSLMAVLGGLFSGIMGWLAVFLFLIFVLVFAYFLFIKKST